MRFPGHGKYAKSLSAAASKLMAGHIEWPACLMVHDALQ